MKLILGRSQSRGLLGEPSFCSEVRVELAQEEVELIRYYKLRTYKSPFFTLNRYSAWSAVLNVSLQSLEQGRTFEFSGPAYAEDTERKAERACKGLIQALNDLRCWGQAVSGKEEFTLEVLRS